MPSSRLICPSVFFEESVQKTRGIGRSRNTSNKFDLKSLLHLRRSIVFGFPFHQSILEKVNEQIKKFDKNFDQLNHAGIDNVFCITISDQEKFESWKKDLNVKNVKLLNDVNKSYARLMGYLVDYSNHGIDLNCWPHVIYFFSDVRNKVFEEPNLQDLPDNISFSKYVCADRMIEFIMTGKDEYMDDFDAM